MSPLTHSTCQRGITRLTLNRPEIHNAFDDTLIRDLTDSLNQLASLKQTRVLVLQSMGKSFSAGADLNWMKKTANAREQDNHRDAVALATMLKTLNCFPAPTIAAVQGAALGGGVGLVSCCDIAIGTERAFFALSEVKLGLIPAAISPFVIEAIGQRAARRYFLSAERFDSATALSLGLLHKRVANTALDEHVNDMIETLLQAGPNAQRAAKELIDAVAGMPHTDELLQDTAKRIAEVRASAEGRDGISAFLEKRKPGWLSE